MGSYDVVVDMGWESVRADARVWSAGLSELHGRFVHRFSRVEPRESALAYMRGLVAPLERKNGWVRHEAPCDRVGVRDPHRRAVAAAG
ncbi:hypothetical protein GCM10010215_25300 [Streptomyces virginiae]|uniref:Uncharacterized protein n=1 Tax=Streptomyces virginiae TaxID=1961 RepID=A0ABQ3NND9_STRVG|nr:hypothetical protein GCM10010215_25300 [Streptomyces virginiae]GHI14291.1 hypothetical protein Scinn_37540 [Streptomyces virginiae]